MRTQFLAAAGALALTFGALPATAGAPPPTTTYDPSQNSILNPFNTTFAFGYETTLSGTLKAYDTETSAHAVDSLTKSGIASLGVYQSETDGSVSLQPGPAGQESVIRFITPTGGSYEIAGTFSSTTGTSSSDVHVYVDGVSAFDGTVGIPATFDFTRALTPSDTVDFLVGPGVTGGYQNDHISLGAQLTLASSAPEPASWAMMLMGFGLAGATVRLRRNASLTA